MKLKVLDLFSGIGGFSLGLERTGGFKTVAFCEIEKFPQKVLKKHWPEIPIYEDVRELTADRLQSDGIGRIDCITGGFPCQDISVAGNQKGIHAERSGLWSEIARLISEIRPRYAIVENVTALLSGDNGRWFQRILGDLVEIGYDCEWHCISASELGAHHHRDRVWIICYPKHAGRDASEIRDSDKKGNGSNKAGQEPGSESEGPGDTENVGDTQIMQRNGCDNHGKDCKCEVSELGDTNSKNNVSDTISQRECSGNSEWKYAENVRQLLRSTRFRLWSPEPSVGRVANGIPRRVDRLKGLGNAVVPQIPELIGRAILEEKCNGKNNHKS